MSDETKAHCFEIGDVVVIKATGAVHSIIDIDLSRERVYYLLDGETGGQAHAQWTGEDLRKPSEREAETYRAYCARKFRAPDGTEYTASAGYEFTGEYRQAVYGENILDESLDGKRTFASCWTEKRRSNLKYPILRKIAQPDTVPPDQRWVEMRPEKRQGQALGPKESETPNKGTFYPEPVPALSMDERFYQDRLRALRALGDVPPPNTKPLPEPPKCACCGGQRKLWMKEHYGSCCPECSGTGLRGGR